MTQDQAKTVIILSGVIHEAVEDKVLSKNYEYKRRFLNSGVDNWSKIINLIQYLRESGNLIAVLAYFTEETLFHTSSEYYREWWPKLLEELEQCKTLIFIYADNLSGIFSRIVELEKDIHAMQVHSLQQASFLRSLNMEPPDDNVDIEEAKVKLNTLNSAAEKIFDIYNEIYECDIEVVPYRRRAEISVRAQDFIDEVEGGVFLRLYVPHGKYRADQFASILRLFENYLQKVEGRDVFIDSRKTQNGIIYIFKDKSAIVSSADLEESMTRFEDFMDLAQNNPKEAEAALTHIGINSTSAYELISRYSMECRHLRRDLRQEVERKLLAIRHRFENEIDDIVIDNALIIQPDESSKTFLSLINNTGPISINVTNVSAKDSAIVQSIIDQELNGDITYTQEDKQLIELFDKYADKLAAIQLKSELDQLKDTSLPEDKRKTSKQRLLGFLYKAGQVVGENAIKLLLFYLEQQIKNPSP